MRIVQTAQPAPARAMRALPVLMTLALAACQPATRDGDTSIATPAAPSPAGAPAPSPATPSPASATPITRENTPTTAEPSAPAPGADVSDINTPAAAARVVVDFFAALAAHRDDAALAYWHDAAQSSGFMQQYDALGRPSVTVEAPGGMEGAAGSVYVTVPVRFAPTSAPANSRERHGEVVVRRVNDVPGSTEAQRRWHIERIDVAMTPK